MKILTRYLTRGNLFLILVILGMGVGMYLLTDFFERLDDVLETLADLDVVLLYFVIKIPLIISQILPAVFLLALIVQFCLMHKNRELTALYAGGVSPLAMLGFILAYGLIWSLVQFGFSQGLGVAGEKAATRIWREEIRGKEPSTLELKGIWFTDGPYVVHIEKAFPSSGRGENLTIYRLDEKSPAILEIIHADAFLVEADSWELYGVSKTLTANFAHEQYAGLNFPLKQDLKAFASLDPSAKASQMNILELSENIARLKKAGSNVEGLRTEWHARLAYAGSIFLMGILAIGLTMWIENIYLAIVAGLVCTFIFYALSTLGNTLGAKGVLQPLLAGWMADLLFLLFGLALIFLKNLPGRTSSPRKA